MQKNVNMIDIEGIKEILPHRYPFLMIDRVLEFETNQYIKAIKNVTVNEPCFQGHFPNKSIMPGVLIVEAFAQAAALLGLQDLGDTQISQDSLFYLVGIDKARFRKPIVKTAAHASKSVSRNSWSQVRQMQNRPLAARFRRKIRNCRCRFQGH